MPSIVLDILKSLINPEGCCIAFRLFSNRIYNVELGRHKRPYVPADVRICEKCNLNQVEDEFHCLMRCKKWNDIRLILFQIACKYIEGFTIFNPAEQFLQILTTKNTNLNFALGKFLQVALKLDSKI